MSKRAEKRAGGTLLRCIAALLVAIVLAGAYAPGAQAETRTLKLYYLHTKERATITYKKNGRYIPSGLTKLNRFLRDWRRNEPTKMDPRLFDLVWEAYRKSGSRDYIHVISGYRSPATNSMLRKRGRGVAKKSQHTLGRAMDFYLPDVRLSKLRRIGLQMQGGGVGYYPRSGSPFVHLDVGSVRHWPRMSRKQLMAMFPGGKTLHLPSDGKPLPGYNIALANYKKRKKSGSTVTLASVSPSGSDRGFLSTLFGGGRDEEEESARDFVSKPAAAPTSVKAAEPAKAPSKPEPAEKTRKPDPPSVETLIAALPARSVPRPLAAPRPARDVGVPAPIAAEPAGQQETLVAAVPLPSWRPSYSAPVAAKPDIPQDVIAELVRKAGAEPSSEAGYVTAMVPTRPGGNLAQGAGGAGQDIRSSLRADRLPVPTSRPEFTVASIEQHPVVLPSVLPAPETKGATAPKSARLARTVKQEQPGKLPVLPSEERMKRLAALSENSIRVAAKGSRPATADIEPDSKPVVVPVDRKVAEWAFRASRIPEIKSTATLAQSAIREQPTTVLNIGFAEAPSRDQLHRFSGNAVTFLSIARFTAAN